MTNKGCPNYIVKTVHSWYFNTRMISDKGISVGSEEIQINQSNTGISCVPHHYSLTYLKLVERLS